MNEQGSAFMQFVKIMEFKKISIFHLDFVASSEETVKRFIAYKYNK